MTDTNFREPTDSELLDMLIKRLERVETVLIENRRGTTNQMHLWDAIHDALKGRR